MIDGGDDARLADKTLSTGGIVSEHRRQNFSAMVRWSRVSVAR